jgi:hypothetical protein
VAIEKEPARAVHRVTVNLVVKSGKFRKVQCTKGQLTEFSMLTTTLIKILPGIGATGSM